VQRCFPSIQRLQESAKTSISRLQDEPEGAAKHFLLVALYTTTNESALSDRQWEALQGDFRAWRQGSNGGGLVRPHQAPCKATHYTSCAHSLHARRHLSDADR